MSPSAQRLLRWDPPLWLKMAIGVAVFLIATRWPTVGIVILVLLIPLVVMGAREKQRRKREDV